MVTSYCTHVHDQMKNLSGLLRGGLSGGARFELKLELRSTSLGCKPPHRTRSSMPDPRYKAAHVVWCCVRARAVQHSALGVMYMYRSAAFRTVAHEFTANYLCRYNLSHASFDGLDLTAKLLKLLNALAFHYTSQAQPVYSTADTQVLCDL